jgi:hypothetical protein
MPVVCGYIPLVRHLTDTFEMKIKTLEDQTQKGASLS